MSAFAERVKQDLIKIRDLSESFDGRVKIKATSGNPVSKIILELDFPTAPSSDFPAKVQKSTEVKIELLSRYPFQEPSAVITTPIFHPNVYSSGQICFGTKWLPTQGLDLLVKRIIKIITFDENILNEKSPANNTALDWYKRAVVNHPGSFPTDKLNLKEPPRANINWKTVESEEGRKTVVSCPGCKNDIRLPAGKRLKVTCPKCANVFVVST